MAVLNGPAVRAIAKMGARLAPATLALSAGAAAAVAQVEGSACHERYPTYEAWQAGPWRYGNEPWTHDWPAAEARKYWEWAWTQRPANEVGLAVDHPTSSSFARDPRGHPVSRTAQRSRR